MHGWDAFHVAAVLTVVIISFVFLISGDNLFLPYLKLHGDAYNYNEREYDEDYYSQPGDLFRLMSPGQQKALFKNTAANMGDSELFIKQRHVRNCYKADPAYGRGVAEALGISLEDALQSAK